MQYGIFSNFYDNLTENVDYENSTDYLCRVFEKYDKLPSLLLDVGCGTGGFSLCFSRRGIDVIGADPSVSMLEVAEKKAKEENLDILFLNQSGQELDLYGTVDGAVACLDTVNHVTDKRELLKFFKKISLFLEKGRLFIFDANTLYKHEKVLADNCFVFEGDSLYCVWQNFYDKKRKITDIYLDFFISEDGKYIRETEEFSERAYSDEELSEMLIKSGFKILDILGENSFNKPKKTEERQIFVCRKVK
jgi:ubiquinone/menaquinone biosynthesis C-methylase UbiE